MKGKKKSLLLTTEIPLLNRQAYGTKHSVKALLRKVKEFRTELYFSGKKNSISGNAIIQ